MNKKKFKNYLGNLILLTVSITIAIVIAELVLRQFITIPPTTSSEYRVPHPVFGWSLKPNASYINELPEKEIEVSYNSNGWRDEEHDLTDTADTFRIVVLGDSFMESYSVDLQNSFAKKIESKISQMGIDVEVYNLGVGGYGTLQEYLVYRDVGPKYKPDIVLLGMYLGNDIRNNSYTLESMLSVSTDKVESRPFLVSSELPAWKISEIDYEASLHRYQNAETNLKAGVKKYVKNTAVGTLLKNSFNQFVGIIRNDSTYLEAQVEKSLALYGVHYCQEPSLYTESWKITERILMRLNKKVSNSKASLVVFTVPSLFEIDKNEMENVYQQIPKSDNLCLEEAPGYDRLDGILEKLDIEYVNLLPPFRDLKQNNKILYNASDKHWNANGHRKATEEVLSYLINNKLLPSIK